MDGKLAIGVDVGGTKILAGIVDRDGTVIRRYERPTEVRSQEALLSELNATVEELSGDGVSAIGFGVPAPIDRNGGRIVKSVNVPLADVSLRERVEARFGLPVGLDNDANAAAIGEWRAGAGRGVDHMVMLTLGTGVGGGVIADGRPFRGATGAGAELGHVVIAHDGPPCQGSCTGRGHLEALCSGHAASEEARKAFGPGVDAHRLIDLADEGDANALEILDRIGRHLGSGIGSFVNIFNPELIVIGGGFGVAALKYLLPAAHDVMRREALDPARDQFRVAPAELGTAAGLIGAAFVAFEALDESS
jgi:glucokinase